MTGWSMRRTGCLLSGIVPSATCVMHVPPAIRPARARRETDDVLAANIFSACMRSNRAAHARWIWGCRMKRVIMTAVVLSFFILPQTTSWAYRDYFTPEQKIQLLKIQTVLVDVVALTDKGSVPAGPIRDMVAGRLADI